jgi:hypothetical protein
MPIAIHINAGNDRNGNPKRGWIIANSDGEFIDVQPAVYRDAMRQAYGALPSIASQQVGSRRRSR